MPTDTRIYSASCKLVNIVLRIVANSVHSFALYSTVQMHHPLRQEKLEYSCNTTYNCTVWATRTTMNYIVVLCNAKLARRPTSCASVTSHLRHATKHSMYIICF